MGGLEADPGFLGSGEGYQVLKLVVDHQTYGDEYDDDAADNKVSFFSSRLLMVWFH